MWFRKPSAKPITRLVPTVRPALEQLEGRDVPSIQGMPSIITMQMPAVATVGAAIADQAIVSGGFSPSGTVTFNLYNNPNGTGPALFTDTETLSNGTATSKGYVASSTGTDFWVATYNGDTFNAAVSSGTADEPVTITPAGPTITTTQLPTTATVGSAIADQAMVNTTGFPPTGTVTFNLYNNPNGTGPALFTDTEAVVGGVSTSKSYIATVVGTDYWVATYSGDESNASVTSGTADEPVIITPGGTPQLQVTKTADQSTVAAGQPVGFTVTITNTGTAAASGVSLSDALPAGIAGDINYTIDTTVGTPADFTIAGPVGSQSLSLSSSFLNGGDSLAAGQTISVHITGLTSAFDATGTSTSTTSGTTTSASNAYLGLAGDYTVLYEGTGGHNLQITNVGIGGNIGVGGTGHVQYNGPGDIGGRVDLAAGNSGQYSNNNGANVGPTSVNYTVSQVTTALNTVNALSASLKGLGTGITLNGNQTINESAGQLDTVNGVTYRVFNVTSYNEGNGNLLTIDGDGSGTPVVFNFGTNSNLNLGGDVSLTGGLTADQVLWNFTSSGQNIQLNNNASSYPSVAFQGVILAPNDPISIVNSNLIGRVFGGDSQDMQIVSGDTITTPPTSGMLANAATVNGVTASAHVTVTPPVTPPPGSPLGRGETATIGFWHNKNGQALIDSFNGGPSATNLGNWLATNFPNLYGSTTGANNLTGATNAKVASYFLTLFGQSGQKTGAQILAAALAVYATDPTLAGGTMATQYGFTVSTPGSGTGIATFNVGNTLAAYGGPTGQVSVFQLLQFVNSTSKNGLIGGLNANLSNAFNTIFDDINQGGDIS